VETDGVLIERSVRGRPDAFVEVVQRHEVAVHGFLARRAGRQVADDLLGEVWVRAFSARDRYDLARHDARPWLYGIARNVLRTYWRTNQVGDRPLPEGALDPWDDVVERLDAAVALQHVVQAVRSLPPVERDVLLLVAWEQLTPAEVAVALGVAPGTVRSRLHRARTTVRSVLAGLAAGRAEEGT
jgi:RNA polymerase sigma-70 factor (ECF subfamily)